MFIKVSEFEKFIEKLTTEQKVEFYELFAHSLTIIIRAFGFDKESSDSLKVSQMKWLNEIQHRIIAKYQVERLQLHQWKESSIMEMIICFVKQEPSIGAMVTWAINSAYEQILLKDH